MTQMEIVERNITIKNLAQSGKTVDEIASELNMNRDRVLMILRSYKIKAVRESHKLHCEKAKEIISELEKGTKQIDIAKKLNVSRQYVNQVRKTLLDMEQTNEK